MKSPFSSIFSRRMALPSTPLSSEGSTYSTETSSGLDFALADAPLETRYQQLAVGFDDPLLALAGSSSAMVSIIRSAMLACRRGCRCISGCSTQRIAPSCEAMPSMMTGRSLVDAVADVGEGYLRFRALVIEGDGDVFAGKCIFAQFMTSSSYGMSNCSNQWFTVSLML